MGEDRAMAYGWGLRAMVWHMGVWHMGGDRAKGHGMAYGGVAYGWSIWAWIRKRCNYYRKGMALMNFVAI